MKLMVSCTALLAMLAAGTLTAQAPQQKSPETQQETTLTGCLNKGSGQGQYSFTDQSGGSAMTVTGPSDLEQHSANHTVRLTGTRASEGGQQVFKVTKIEHIAATCATGGGKNK